MTHLGMAVESTNSIGMAFVVIPAGEFTMGSPRFEAGREQGETEHRVTLTQPFEMGIYEVTQAQYEQVVGRNPSRFKGAKNPVDTVSWLDAIEFCRLLSALPAERAAGRKYRLPTEAEWEYACRAGTATTYSFGDDERQLAKYAWYDNQSGGYSTHPVGRRQGNAWGIFDMHGNVWEWCFDWIDWNAPYTAEAVSDPQGPQSGGARAIRGGAFFFNAADVRCANRDAGGQEHRDPNGSGFRVVMTQSGRLPKAVTVKESPVPSAQISPQPDPTKSSIDVATSGKALNEAAIDQFTGRWRIINPAGQTSFFMTLSRSFSAEKTDRPKPSGVWEVVGNEARITWSDGWRDILRPENGEITKIAFKPKTSWDATPDNIERAVKMTEPDDGKSK